MTRLTRFAPVLALAVALAGAAACGIDEDQVATGVAEARNGGTTSSTTGSTEPGGPDISLPDIPADVTEPEDTVVDPTEPEDTVPDSEATPGGLTQDDLQIAFEATGFTEDQSACMAIGVFATLDGDAIDSLATGDESLVDPDVLGEFQEIVQTCVQGG